MSENLPNDSESQTSQASPRAGQPPLIEPDEQEIAAKLAAIIHSNPWMSPDHIKRHTQRIMQMNATVGAKRQRLIELADRVNAAVQPHAACRAGCSYCCSMPTMIYRHEAERLAEASGRPAIPLRFRPRGHALLAAHRFYGQACPFLNEGRCTVLRSAPDHLPAASLPERIPGQLRLQYSARRAQGCRRVQLRLRRNAISPAVHSSQPR